ncbi:MAG TPA: (2Fe-2S)-binding protein [Egibacteraceae bacterium]|nr:(2Fe-2S)-binding protein [Egibacteraceae bacterium]
MEVTLLVNGIEHTIHVEPRRLLADVLRQDLGLFGTHLGCEHGVCGACTVLVDGEPTRSCLVFAVQMEGQEIETIEGIDPDDPVARAFKEAHGLQCGFCTPAFVLTVSHLLREDPDPDEETIREAISGNICRCTGYVNIVKAVRVAAASSAGE